jgi:multidrug efflux system membrane fusion protein
MSLRSPFVLCGQCLAAALAAGCTPAPPPVAEARPPVVPVSQPIERRVTDFADYTGRTAAVLSLDVRPRNSGYLVQMPFREGSEVKKGELLFEIDPAPYRAQYQANLAQVGVAQAALELARITYERNRLIFARNPGAVSQQELDQSKAQMDQAAANLKLAQANLEAARIRLDWTRVTAPFDGQVSRYYLTLGNLAVQDQTLLTTIVSLDPIYVYFDIDERTVLKVRKGINAGTIRVPVERTAIPVDVGLEGEEGYPHRGTLDFINNAINPSTGTILARGVFENPNPSHGRLALEAGEVLSLAVPGAPSAALTPALVPVAAASLGLRPGRRLMSPGMFVRVRLPIGQPHPALLVIDRAIGSDQGLKFVYVVGADNKIQYRPVTTGALQDDGLRVVESGVGRDDWVVVGALQQVRPNMPVEPDRVEMPTLGLAPPAETKGPQPPPAGGAGR